jgi:hypothetical protein
MSNLHSPIPAWLLAASDLDLDCDDADDVTPWTATGMPVCELDCARGDLFYRTLKAWCVPWAKVPLAAFLPAWFALGKRRRDRILDDERLFADELDVHEWLPNMLKRDDAAMLAVLISGAVCRKRVVVQWINEFMCGTNARRSLGAAFAAQDAVRCLELYLTAPNFLGDGTADRWEGRWEPSNDSSSSFSPSPSPYALFSAGSNAVGQMACCAAKHGCLALLEILDGRHGSVLRRQYCISKNITFAAAKGGHLECLQFLRGKEYHWNAENCISAAAAAPRVQDWIAQNKTRVVPGDDELVSPAYFYPRDPLSEPPSGVCNMRRILDGHFQLI